MSVAEPDVISQKTSVSSVLKRGQDMQSSVLGRDVLSLYVCVCVRARASQRDEFLLLHKSCGNQLKGCVCVREFLVTCNSFCNIVFISLIYYIRIRLISHHCGALRFLALSNINS